MAQMKQKEVSPRMDPLADTPERVTMVGSPAT